MCVVQGGSSDDSAGKEKSHDSVSGDHSSNLK